MKFRLFTLIFLYIIACSSASAETRGTLSEVITNINKIGYNAYRVVWHPEKHGFYNAVVYSPGSETWAFIQTMTNGDIKNEYLISKPRGFNGDPNSFNLLPAVKAVANAGYTPTAVTWGASITQVDAVTADDKPVKLKVDTKTSMII